MHPVYATQFEVHDASFDEVEQRIEAWISGKCRSQWGADVDLAFEEGESKTAPVEGHQLSVSHHHVKEGSLLDVTWNHPDQDRRSLAWSVSFMIAEDDGALEVSSTIGVSSTRFSIRPFDQLHIGAPGVIQDLLRDFKCFDGDLPIPSKPRTASEEEVEFFVSKILESEARKFPIALFSRTGPGEETSRPIKELQERLWGLAHVYGLTVAAGYRLTDLAGTKGSCYNGAARIYWPGYERHKDYLRNTLFYQAHEIDTTFQHALFDEIAEVSAFRFREGSLFRKISRKVELEKQRHAKERQRREREEVEELRRRAERGESSQEELIEKVHDLNDQKARLENEKDEYAALYVEADDQADELSGRVETLEDNNEALISELRRSRREEALEKAGVPLLSSVPAEPETVEEALEKAEAEYGEYLEIWDSAREAAAESDSNRFSDVFDALEVLAEVAEQYCEMDGDIGEPINHAVKAKGYDCKDDSERTMNDHGHERRFKNKGRTLTMPKHITIKSDTKNGVQIYFSPDESKQKFLVGYCGRHLQYATQNT